MIFSIPSPFPSFSILSNTIAKHCNRSVTNNLTYYSDGSKSVTESRPRNRTNRVNSPMIKGLDNIVIMGKTRMSLAQECKD